MQDQHAPLYRDVCKHILKLGDASKQLNLHKQKHLACAEGCAHTVDIVWNNSALSR